MMMFLVWFCLHLLVFFCNQENLVASPLLFLRVYCGSLGIICYQVSYGIFVFHHYCASFVTVNASQHEKSKKKHIVFNAKF